MMGLRRSGRLLFMTSLVVMFAIPATEPLADPAQGSRLDAYMVGLEQMRQAWRQAAESVVRGEVERAIGILEKPLPEVLGMGWSEVQKMHRDELRSMNEVRFARMGTRRFAKWCMGMQHPGLAARAYEAALEARDELNFEDKFHLTQCYVEDAQNGKAKAALRALLGKETADWDEMIEARIKAIDGLETGGISREVFLRVYCLETGPRWYQDRAGPLLDAWDLPAVSDRDRAGRWDLLTRLFEQLSLPRDGGTGRLLVLEAVANDALAKPEQVAPTLLKLAESADLAGKSDEAKRYWVKVVEDFRGTRWWAKAVLEIGRTCKEQRRYGEAISWFQRVLDEPENGRWALGDGGRFAAQWAIGDCFLEQGRYEQALAAYRATREKYPSRSGCGTCLDGELNRTALHEGACLENLGRHAEAAEGYYRRALSPGGDWNPILSSRLVDLYEAAGQVADLEAMLDARHLPSGPLRRILEIRRMEIAQDWDSLVSLLRGEHTTSGPEKQHARTVEYEAMEAAKRLARHPDQAVPRIKARLNTSRPQDRPWFFYALGLCGTPEAVAVLKQLALDDQNKAWAFPLAYALKVAGEGGLKAIKDLSPMATGNLKSALQVERPRDLRASENEITLPKIPAALKLPRQLKEERQRASD